MFKVFAELNEIKYIWTVFAKNREIPFVFIPDKKDADFIIDFSSESDLSLSKEFYDKIKSEIFSFDNFFKKDCLIRTKEGKNDYLATAFYMINALQEYGSKDLDVIGRFNYKHSYQYIFKNVQENLVQECFDKLHNENPKLSKFNSPEKKTRFFFSHDLDSINGALFQDGLALVKKGNLLPIFPIVMNAVLNKPDWLNMDKIMKMESKFDYKSTFYWLVNQGKINERESNSDYNIKTKNIRNMINQIEGNGFESGLHKSISTDSFEDEFRKLELKPIGNRYHYLKFTLPDAFDKIEKSGLLLDASLGFAEAYGFRNSYGLPFNPYNLNEGKPYSFVEVPLNLMDGTFRNEMNVPMEKTADMIIEFIEMNKTNCILSVLWHNTFFTKYKYKGYGEQYKKLLAYLYENKYSCITQKEIIDEYSWEKQYP